MGKLDLILGQRPIKTIAVLFCSMALLFFGSCARQKTASDILKETIHTIDTIESIFYKQDMIRTDPRNIENTISRYREIYLKRLISDSIVGAQGHWYMFTDDKTKVIYEDIYNGNTLIRINNRDSLLKIYDLVKHPEFKKNHFWSHNTLFAMQYEMKLMLEAHSPYELVRMSDTVIDNKSCYQINVKLANKSTRPGFATNLVDSQGSISRTIYSIDKNSYYPLHVKGEFYTMQNTDQKHFIDQLYYDIKFNLEIDEALIFNTSKDSLVGFSISEVAHE